jgi:hypothetical protein
MVKRILRLTLILFITASFLSLFMSCKRQSTAPEMPNTGGDNSISVSCSPSSGGTGTEVIVMVSINKNQGEIKAFGLTIGFDPDVFQYVSAGKGILTQSWSVVDGNVNEPGQLVAGGFAGTGFSVPAGSSGNLLQVKLKVIYSGSNDNFASQITIKNYLDDISDMAPKPASATFTFKK